MLSDPSRSSPLTTSPTFPLELQLAILKLSADSEDQTYDNKPRSPRSRKLRLEFCEVSGAYAVSSSYSASVAEVA